MKAIVFRAALAAIACIFAACGMGYRNGQQCKQKMIATYPSSEPVLSFDRTNVAYRGSRVVVEATYEGVVKSLVTTAMNGRTTKTVHAKKVDFPAAVECTFHGETLNSFRWLAPAKFARVYEPVVDGDD